MEVSLDLVSDKKEKLLRKKARLVLEENRLDTLERKKRTRRLIELGGLVLKAGLESFNNNTLLGGFLFLKNEYTDKSKLKKLTDEGDHAFTEIKKPVEELSAFVITFPKEPSREIKSQLRDLNFKWNQFRKEWYGYGNEKELRTLIESDHGHIESCDV
jgi:hypothetical protein